MSSHATATGQPPRMSFEQFVQWCDEDTYAEWVDGEVDPMTAPGTRHQDLLVFLVTLLRMFAEEQEAGRVLAAPYLVKLPRSGRLPDILFVAKENEHRLGKLFLQGAPDLAVEIVSPESRSRDRRDKHREYAEAGVREFWLIDPEGRRAEFFHLNEQGAYEPLPIVDDTFRSRVLDGLWIRVEWLWQEPLPPLLQVLREWGLV